MSSSALGNDGARSDMPCNRTVRGNSSHSSGLGDSGRTSNSRMTGSSVTSNVTGSCMANGVSRSAAALASNVGDDCAFCSVVPEQDGPVNHESTPSDSVTGSTDCEVMEPSEVSAGSSPSSAG